jgi:hypothetical protein
MIVPSQAIGNLGDYISSLRSTLTPRRQQRQGVAMSENRVQLDQSEKSSSNSYSGEMFRLHLSNDQTRTLSSDGMLSSIYEGVYAVKSLSNNAHMFISAQIIRISLSELSILQNWHVRITVSLNMTVLSVSLPKSFILFFVKRWTAERSRIL